MTLHYRHFLPLFAILSAACSDNAESYGSGTAVAGPSYGGSTVGGSTVTSIPNEATAAIITDGSHVYFATVVAPDETSSSPAQETEHGNLYVITSDGNAQQLNGVNPFPDAIAVDEFYVYYATYDGAGIARVMKDGSSGGQTLASQLPGTAMAIAIDSSWVFASTNAGIVRVAKTGGAVTTVAPDANGAAAIVADDSFVYWIDRGTTESNTASIMRATVSGDDITTLGTSSSLSTTWNYSLAQDADSLYFPNPSEGRVYRMKKADGSITVVATGVNSPSAVVVDDSNVYFTQTPSNDDSSRAIFAASKAGGSQPFEIASAEYSGVYAIAVDSSNIYWTDYVTTGSVYEAPKDAYGSSAPSYGEYGSSSQ